MVSQLYYVFEIKYFDGKVELYEIKEVKCILGCFKVKVDLQVVDKKVFGWYVEFSFMDGKLMVIDFGSINGILYGG